MAENPSPPLSESEKLAATLAQLEAEREKRLAAGTWSREARPMLMAVQEEGESEEVGQQRALYAYLAEHPDAPKTIAAYDWIVQQVISPRPTIEPPDEFYAPDHDHAVDVTPPPFRPPMPPTPPEPPREPLSYSNASVPRIVLERELKRYRNFLDGDWGDPSDGPIRYGRGRSGW